MMWLISPAKQRRMQDDAERAIRRLQEQQQRKPSKVEVFARAYCKELGYDPDSQWLPGPMMLPQPRWTKYREIAERELHYQATAAGFEAVEAAGKK